MIDGKDILCAVRIMFPDHQHPNSSLVQSPKSVVIQFLADSSCPADYARLLDFYARAPFPYAGGVVGDR